MTAGSTTSQRTFFLKHTMMHRVTSSGLWRFQRSSVWRELRSHGHATVNRYRLTNPLAHYIGSLPISTMLMRYTTHSSCSRLKMVLTSSCGNWWITALLTGLLTAWLLLSDLLADYCDGSKQESSKHILSQCTRNCNIPCVLLVLCLIDEQ